MYEDLLYVFWYHCLEDLWFVLSTVGFSVVSTNRQGALRQQDKKDDNEDTLTSNQHRTVHLPGRPTEWQLWRQMQTPQTYLTNRLLQNWPWWLCFFVVVNCSPWISGRCVTAMQFGFRKSQVVFIISVLNSSLHVCMSLLTNMTNGALFKTCVLTERAIFLSNGKKNCTSISWELWSFVFLFFPRYSTHFGCSLCVLYFGKDCQMSGIL